MGVRRTDPRQVRKKKGAVLEWGWHNQGWSQQWSMLVKPESVYEGAERKIARYEKVTCWLVKVI